MAQTNFVTDLTDPDDPVEVVNSTGGQEEEDNEFIVLTNLRDLGKIVFTYSYMRNLYDSLTNQEFLDLIWVFRYYDEIFDTGETENLEQAIKESIDNTNDASLYNANRAEIIQHKIFKNLLLNVKQISFLDQSSGDFKIMTYEDLQNFYAQENKFFIARIDMGQKLIDSLDILGLKNKISNNFRGIAFAKHDVGYKYFILSSESIMFSDYLDILPQSRISETYYQNSFDTIEVPLPPFETETDISFTYLKSNYVFQSETANMSLKGVDQDLSSTETTADIGVVSTSNTGY
jgi:hypothetical protein